MDIEVRRLGSGPETIVMVHGSLTDGSAAFVAQEDLASRWTLVIPNRRGYGNNPPVAHVDLDLDAGDVAGLLGDGAHLVGTSMGGVVATRAAALAPERVHSLTVIEPPAYQNAADIPVVAEAMAGLRRHWANADRDDVRGFLAGFLKILEIGLELPTPLPPPVAKAAQNLMSEDPWLTSAPVDRIAACPFPKLVVSGDCSRAFEAICDRLAEKWDATRRVFPGAGHAVQRIGAPFNELLEDFIAQASRARAGQR